MRAHLEPIRATASGCIAILLLALAARAQTLELQDVSSAGVQGDVWSEHGMSISDDDRFVAFTSRASNLVLDDTNGKYDIFARDNLTGATVLVSRTPAGAPSNGDSLYPSLSSNGRYIAFLSLATNLVVPGVPVGHIYRRDRDTDADGIFDEPGAVATILVSVNSSGTPGNLGGSLPYAPSTLSDDGNRVAFLSASTNLVSGDTNGVVDVFVRTISTGSTVRVNLSTSGAQGINLYTILGSISGDGSTVAFHTQDALDPADTNGFRDVYVRVLATGVTSRVSVGALGEPNSASFDGSLSDDGNLVAFDSFATNLVAGDTNGDKDVFVRNRSAGTTTRASQGSIAPPPYTPTSVHGRISGDGRFVTFGSLATDHVPGDTNGFTDVFVRDLATGSIARASRAVDGTQANGNSGGWGAAISDDGSHVVFASEATNLVTPDLNGGTQDMFRRGAPFLPPEGSSAAAIDGAVTFSVNGPVDPHTEGLRDARGAPPTPQVPLQPGNPTGHCLRDPAVPPATGIDSPWPGDVFDYAAFGLPCEAVLFQSPPYPPAFVDPPLPPDGTDNQILESVAVGLVSGPPVPLAAWTSVPPFALARDNLDAFSFGEDYFPPAVVTGLDPTFGLPAPPLDAMGEVDPAPTVWEARASVYAEPIVVDDAPGISLRFSVDPWALGVAPMDVFEESLGFDVGADCGPWESDGEAAGDVFATLVLERVGGATVGGGFNLLAHDNAALALAPAAGPLFPMEDDLDGLECVGENTVPWFFGSSVRSGNLHERTDHVGPPDPAAPGLSVHDPQNDAPVFFSVTRSSPGEPLSGVRSQFVIDGGAAADVFVAAKDPADPAGDGTNLLFLDEAELGLYALDSSPGTTGAADACDDLDGLLLWVCPDYRDEVSLAIDEILGLVAPPLSGVAAPGGDDPWVDYGYGGAQTGGGMTSSIVAYLAATGRPVPPDCIRVGFSVSTDSIGLEFTAVDYEAGPVFPFGAASSAAGDVFFAAVDGAVENPNYLWYEEFDLGLDAGAWVPGASIDLAELSDDVDALDSIDVPPPLAFTYCTPGTTTHGCAASIAGVGTPSASLATPFTIDVSGVEGAKQGLIFYGLSGPLAAPYGASWLCVKAAIQRTPTQLTGGTDGLCDGALTLDWNAYVASHPATLGAPFSMGQDVWTQGWFRDPPAPKTTNLSDALEFTLGP